MQLLRQERSVSLSAGAVKRWQLTRPAVSCCQFRPDPNTRPARALAACAFASEHDPQPAAQPYIPHDEALYQFSNSMLDGRALAVGTPADLCPSLGQLRASELASVIHALADMPVPPAQDELQDLLDASYNQIMHFSPLELANTIAALSGWGATPGEIWLERFEQQTYRCVTEATPEQVSTFVWGFAQLGHRPQLALDALLDAAADSLDAYSPCSIASIVWALAKMELPPAQEWAHALLRASYSKLMEFAPSDLAKLLWGLAKLGLRPGSKWMGGFLAAAQLRLAHFDPKSLSLTIWAMASLSYRPSSDWMDAFQRQVACQVAQFGAQELTCLLWGLAQLTHQRQEELLGQILNGQEGFAELDYQVLQNPKLLGVIMSLRQGNGSGSGGSSSGNSSASA